MSRTVFPHKWPWLSGQASHRGDPFSASPHCTPQLLCLLWMCPLCLVPYPIILCPCPKNPGSDIVLLTCSILPIINNTHLCLPSSLANVSHPPQFSLWFCSTFISAIVSSLHSFSFIFSLFTHFPFALNTFFHPQISVFYINEIITLFFHIFYFSLFIISDLLSNRFKQGDPTSLNMENEDDTSAARLAPSTSIITLSSFLHCRVLPGSERCRLLLGL